MSATVIDNAKVACQTALTHVGARSPQRAIVALNRAVDYLEVGRWLHERGFDPGERVGDRTELFDLAARETAVERVHYMEFGVHEGASMRYWSQILEGENATLHGFDSFEGLPEYWNATNPRGHFSTRGALPAIDDPRVTFFKGWFDQTLPEYQWPTYDRLVVNFDADLYSSTKYVLDAIATRLTPGSFVYFDEFMDRHHELRAFAEFLDETAMAFELRGATRKLGQVLFQRVG